MSFIDTVQTGWQQVLDALSSGDERKKLLEGLCEQYCTETHNAAQFAVHAQRMYYPQFRDRLLRIAAEEKAHIRWLHEQIRTLGGDVSEPTVTLKVGQNSWECLLLDLEEEKRSCTDLMTQIHTAMHVDPGIADGLLRLRAEEQRHYEELREMLMKSDPYTPPAPQVRNEKLERQKHEWLAQQKGEWFERQQAEWEAKGKLIPWAGWEGELEYQWTVNELPSLELAWERRVAEEEIAEEEASTHKASFLR